MEINEEKITYMLNIVIISISIILIIIYISYKFFHQYYFYCNLLFLFLFLINNILRIIEKRKDNTFNDDTSINDIICKTQAYLLSFTDKLILTILSMISFLTYYGNSNYIYYKTHESKFFFFSLLISILISLSLPLFYYFLGCSINLNSQICFIEYDEYDENNNKCYNRIIDFCFVSFLLCFNFYYLLNILFYLTAVMRDKISAGKNVVNYNSNLVIIIFIYLFNGFLYLIILLRLNEKMFLDDKYFDLCYIITCLVIEVFYCVNKHVLKIFLYVLSCCRVKFNNNSKNEYTDNNRINTGSDILFSDLSLSL